jgi:predicted nucleotidyltransferase
MRYDEFLSAMKSLAMKTNANIGDACWYLFGSSCEGLPTASDIDLLIVCETNEMADAVRRSVDVDQFARPIHLSILTQAEQL